MWVRRTSIVTAVLALLAAACGDSGTTTAPPVTAPPAATPPTTGAPPGAPPDTEPAPTTTATTTAGVAAATTTAAPRPAAWTQLATAGDAPAPRRNAVLVVDGVANVAYLHGGRSGGTSLADLWQLDLASGAWTKLENGGPDARFSHTGIWDEARRRLVIFSGQGEGFGDFFSDVWAYDPADDVWERLAPNLAGPADRYGSCAGYDALGDRFVITHGFTNSGRFDDTWQFDLGANSWHELTPDGPLPGARCLHACAYDPAAERLVMFGGQNDDVAFLADTWAIDAGGWIELAGGPSARKFPAVAPAGDGIVLFGGDSADGDRDDTWLLAGADWAELQLEGRPPPRESHAAGHDPSTGAIWVFGGAGPDGELNDVWAFTPGT